MKNLFKILGGGIGWALGGPLGALLGLAAGQLIGEMNSGPEEGSTKKHFSRKPNQTGDFHISLLVLSALVIKADGKIDQRELDEVRLNFVRMFGKEKANESFSLFKSLLKEKIDLEEITVQIRRHINYSARLQVLDYLFKIANSDGTIVQDEVDVIRKIATHLYIRTNDFNSIYAMYGRKYYRGTSTKINNKEANYKILEIEISATDDEVKKAYRKLVRKYHPDKLQGLGEDVIEAGREKFIKVQDAYEEICKERGIK